MGFIILRQTYNLCLRMFVCITTHLLGIHTLQHFQCKSCSKSMMSILFLYPQFTFLTWYILHVLVERTSLVKKYITFVLDIHVLLLSNRDVHRMLTSVMFLLDTVWIKSWNNLPNYLSCIFKIYAVMVTDNLDWIVLCNSKREGHPWSTF